MNPTMSKDGKVRATVRVQHRVDLDQVVSILCLENQSVGDDPPDLSRSAIDEQVRRELRFRGLEGADYWRDDVPDDEADALEEWATELVLRRYPEFRP